MTHFVYRSDKWQVGQMVGRTNVGRTNVDRTNVGRTKLVAPFKSVEIENPIVIGFFFGQDRESRSRQIETPRLTKKAINWLKNVRHGH